MLPAMSSARAARGMPRRGRSRAVPALAAGALSLIGLVLAVVFSQRGSNDAVAPLDGALGGREGVTPELSDESGTGHEERSAIEADELEAAEQLGAADAAAAGRPPKEGEIRGRVVNAAGAPLAGARVVARFLATREFAMIDLELGKTERDVAEQVTGADGRFALIVPAAHPLDLVARCSGYGSVLAPRVYAGEEREIVLSAACVLSGRVVRARDGSPVEGVAMRGWSSPSSELFRGETDHSGRFRFEDLPEGPLTLTVEPNELAAPEWQRIELRAGETLEREIALQDGLVIKGRITDAQSGAAISDAVVYEGWTGRKRVRSGADGSYRLAGFGGPGVYDIHVHAEGYGKAVHQFPYLDPPTADLELDFALPPARRARGRVVDRRGEPIADAYVAALFSSIGVMEPQRTDWEATWSGTDGRFELASLHPELPHTLFVRKPGHGTVLYDFPPSERDSFEIVLPDVALPDPARVEGRVLDESGAPRPALPVVLYGWNADYLALSAGGSWGMDQGILDHYVGERSSRTDSLGRFQFDDLAAGRYTLRVDLTGQRDRVREGVERIVEVSEGAWVRDLELVLPSGLSIAGRVIVPDGRSLLGVTVRPKSSDNAIGQGVMTDADGAFELAGLAPGTYTLFANPTIFEEGAERYAGLEHHGIEAGARDVELVLPLAARLEGVILGADGAPFARAYVCAKNAEGRQVSGDVADLEGRFSMEVAADMPLRLEAQPTRPSDASPLGVERIGGDVDKASLEDVHAPASGLVLRLPAHSG